MIRPAGNSRSPIGLSFDGRAICAVQLAGGAGGWRLEAAGHVPRMSQGPLPDQAEVRQLCGMLARKGFKGAKAVLALPRDRFKSAVLELPPRSSGAPLEQIAAAELARMHGYDPQAAEVTCWDLPPSGRLRDATQVMSVACLHSDADAVLEAFEPAGIKVLALDSPVLALERACGGKLRGSGISALLDLGWDCALLVLFCQDQIIYDRPTPEGAIGRLAEALSSRLGLGRESLEYVLAEVSLAGEGRLQSDDQPALGSVVAVVKAHVDALLNELSAPFSYAGHQYAPAAVERLLVTGQGASMPHLAGYVQSRMKYAVSVLAPADVAQVAPDLAAASADPALLTALGAARFFERQIG